MKYIKNTKIFSQLLFCCFIHVIIIILYFKDGVEMSQSPFPHCVIENFVESTDKGSFNIHIFKFFNTKTKVTFSFFF